MMNPESLPSEDQIKAAGEEALNKVWMEFLANPESFDHSSESTSPRNS